MSFYHFLTLKCKLHIIGNWWVSVCVQAHEKKTAVALMLVLLQQYSWSSGVGRRTRPANVKHDCVCVCVCVCVCACVCVFLCVWLHAGSQQCSGSKAHTARCVSVCAKPTSLFSDKGSYIQQSKKEEKIVDCEKKQRENWGKREKPSHSCIHNNTLNCIVMCWLRVRHNNVKNHVRNIK